MNSPLIAALALLMALLVGASLDTPLATAQDAPEATGATDSADPGDRIIAHIQAMTRIVEQHKDQPAEVKSLFTGYLEDNGDAMKAANRAFEERVAGLPTDEAQGYQERFQRKLEKPLQAFLTAMLEFSTNHPEVARELDELLRTTGR